MISGTTRVIAHLGYPTDIFKAPLIYNPWFEANDIDAVVVPIGVQGPEYPSLLRSLASTTNLLGALVTFLAVLILGFIVALLLTLLVTCGSGVLLGLLVKNSIIWGLAYVLLWEGLFTQFSDTIGQAAIRGYLRGLLANLSDVDLNAALDTSTPTAIIVCAVIAGASLMIASLRLDSMEVD